MAGQENDLNTTVITLTQHILKSQQKHKEATGDLSILLTAISSACKWISNVVRKADLLNVIGVTGIQNIQAENVQKLDVLSNEIMINMLTGSGRTALLISEEVDEAILIDKEQKGHYAVAFDPLDGSSNIDCGVSVGTIFGIYKLDILSDKPLIDQIYCPGSKLVAGGYCMYGSCTSLVLAMGGEVNGYTLDPNIGEFLLTHKNMKIGNKKIYSVNEGYAHSFEPAVANYLNTLKFPPPGHQGKFSPYSSRYVGSMVADLHRTLLYGGIFLYPLPKLRLLYECFPMAMIIEAAGGKASTGTTRILDLIPKDIHGRSPIFLGTSKEVEAIEDWFKKSAGKQ